MDTTAAAAARRSVEEGTLRERAITLRLGWIAEEQGKGFRGDDLFSADEKREKSRRLMERLRREVATLRAMPADVSDDEVRRAMGVAA